MLSIYPTRFLLSTLAVGALILLLTGCVGNAVGPAPATGQTTAYPADKNDGIPGAVGVLDDGTVQAGATLSYTDNGNGTVTDANTGLMWEKKDDSNGLHDKDNAYDWALATGTWVSSVSAEGGTGFAGRNDWRVPTAQELQSIVDYSRTSPASDPVFGPTLASGYWSSTSSANGPSDAWVVFFSDGVVITSGKSGPFIVRAVRGGLWVGYLSHRPELRATQQRPVHGAESRLEPAAV
ncbi:MAG: DUF1566 domain-containing protein [Deltaproteobacteria bacterium]|nr:DUF1566 domain-containing protein [Deltaproteobacteria bacterium]